MPECERQQIKKNKNKEAQRRSRRMKKEQFYQKEIELKQALQRIEELERREEQYKMKVKAWFYRFVENPVRKKINSEGRIIFQLDKLKNMLFNVSASFHDKHDDNF